jgi:excinuclease ABC subunit B
MEFQLTSDYTLSGDQSQAVAKLHKSLEARNPHQTLLGVTGSGKTFSMAHLIQRVGLPTLVMSHNKTLAAQLYSEFKNFFPHNAVEYFVSYFDYYQPEAYIPRSDTYIEKDSSINDEIERLRLSTMGSLLTRDDTVVIASVSCIYGLGSPDDYQNMMFHIATGQELRRDDFVAMLCQLMFERNDIAFGRGKFRVRGDVVEIHPAYLENTAIRVEFFGDQIERLSCINPLTGTLMERIETYCFFPAKQFVTPAEKMKHAMRLIRAELDTRIHELEKANKLLEAQRLRMRTEYDLEMMNEMGFCQGIENYARHITGREPGARPYTLLDFFPKDFLLLIDESHATIPQIGGMYEGDKSRKSVLVEHGFRLPSAMDNRPLKFKEFIEMTDRRVYVSATPGAFELVNSRPDNPSYIPVSTTPGERSYVDRRKLKIKISTAAESVESFNVTKPGFPLIVEQIIRPTGLLDPKLHLLPLQGQIDATIDLCRGRVERGERALVTTLTKKTAEDLTEYLKNTGLKVRYIHSDVDTVERVEILRQLRRGAFDVLVGINLLREGLDLPEVSLVAILDADKEGFLRSETSLIQTIGRSARNVNAKVILYADRITEAMRNAIAETARRRKLQQDFNEAHGITPQTVKKNIAHGIESEVAAHRQANEMVGRTDDQVYITEEYINELEQEMLQAAEALEFERAAAIRDRITHMRDAIGEPISAVREQSGGFKGRGKKGKRGRVPRPKADG